jgi:hypothetical protein
MKISEADENIFTISKLTGWVIGSTVSYMCAVAVTNMYGFNTINPTSFVLAGFVGATILSLNFHLFVHHVPWKYFVLAGALGALIAGFISAVWSNLFPFDLYVFWQFAVTYTLARSASVGGSTSTSSTPAIPTQTQY